MNENGQVAVDDIWQLAGVNVPVPFLLLKVTVSGKTVNPTEQLSD
jgi:hypothetical protein